MNESNESQATHARLPQRIGAEMMGTFALVFIGCGAIMVDTLRSGIIGHLGVSSAFGGIIAVMICATGHISGAHFNPGVTLAFASTGRFPWRDVPGYIVGQFIAALVAALLLRWILGDVAAMGMTFPTPGISLGGALVVEIILTAFLMFVIISVATDARAAGTLAGVAIGATVAVCALFGGPLTGASMNPARSLGPALAHGTFDFQWMYLVAPLIGAQLGAWAYEWMRGDR